VTVVFGVERLAGTDLLWLANGEKLKGSVLNENFSLRTAYAQVTLDRHSLAGIDSGVPAAALNPW